MNAPTLPPLVDGPGFSLAHRRIAPSAPSNGPSPVLILLHGVGANEVGLADFAARQDPRLTVQLARGPLTLGPGQFAWFQVRFGPTGPVIAADQAEASRQGLLHFIDEAVAAYGLDPAQVWLAGFSQGGIMSASVGLTRPDKLAGFGILSGRILPEITPLIAPDAALAHTQAWVSHGLQDSKLPIDWANKAKALLDAHGVPLSFHTYPADHALTPAMQQDFIAWVSGQLDQPGLASRPG